MRGACWVHLRAAAAVMRLAGSSASNWVTKFFACSEMDSQPIRQCVRACVRARERERERGRESVGERCSTVCASKRLNVEVGIAEVRAQTFEREQL